MKKVLIAFLLVVGLTGVFLFSGTGRVNVANQAVETRIDKNKYVITIVEDQISLEQAKEMAMQRAAELSKQNGCNYFTIDSQKEVTVIKTTPSSDNGVPSNQYYDMIQGGNFGKNQIDQSPGAEASQYKAWRIEITCYEKKPLFGRSYAVSDYLDVVPY